MRKLTEILVRHRRDLIDNVTGQICADVVPRLVEDEASLRATIEALFDGLIELIESGASSGLHERLNAVARRGVLGGFWFGDFLRATYSTAAPELRTVLEREGAEFAEAEPVLAQVAIAAADAYSAAYQARLLELQELRRSSEAEADRLRVISHLVMGVAQELAAPLKVISQEAELMARNGNGDTCDAAELIGANVTRASRLIHRFRGLSVSESPDVVQAVDVAGAVADAISQYRTTIVEPKLDIKVVDRLGTVEGDGHWHGHRLYFTHVLLNLLANAEHHAYRDAGGPVEIVLAREDDRLHVTVSDQGVGIPESEVDKLSSPFFSTGRTSGRTGLGMAVVHNLVTAGMHGTLDIDSEVGVGTRVCLDLPWRDGPRVS